MHTAVPPRIDLNIYIVLMVWTHALASMNESAVSVQRWRVSSSKMMLNG